MFLQLSIALIGSYAMINFIKSIVGFLKLPRPEDKEFRASVSYIIPARNEEGKSREVHILITPLVEGWR